ncbi:MAG TPA: M48 family metallopeptidase, partial [Candidatus Baltobacteraceae bacterium]|nr:M48 family metallopeptidase [Candidatus Baltobacteraceae bacterium]
FNYRLTLLPPRLAEYVVVHELCHLLEFNHSPRFWALVALTVPEHRALRKILHHEHPLHA